MHSATQPKGHFLLLFSLHPLLTWNIPLNFKSGSLKDSFKILTLEQFFHSPALALSLCVSIQTIDSIRASQFAAYVFVAQTKNFHWHWKTQIFARKTSKIFILRLLRFCFTICRLVWWRCWKSSCVYEHVTVLELMHDLTVNVVQIVVVYVALKVAMTHWVYRCVYCDDDDDVACLFLSFSLSVSFALSVAVARLRLLSMEENRLWIGNALCTIALVGHVCYTSEIFVLNYNINFKHTHNHTHNTHISCRKALRTTVPSYQLVESSSSSFVRKALY